MKASVQYTTRGIKGGAQSPYRTTGSINILMDGGYMNWKPSYIYVDSFQGQGDTYKSREKSEITIQHGDKEWTGTMDELINILKP